MWTLYKQWPLAFICGSAGPKLDTRVRVIIVLVLAVGPICLLSLAVKAIDCQARECQRPPAPSRPLRARRTRRRQLARPSLGERLLGRTGRAHCAARNLRFSPEPAHSGGGGSAGPVITSARTRRILAVRSSRRRASCSSRPGRASAPAAPLLRLLPDSA